MSDLHGDIMNLQARMPADMKNNESQALAYKMGHRDARHDAAELSLGYESKIESLEEEITRLKAIIEGQIPSGYVLLPVQPSKGLLMSMAIRNDHGFGVPGYYDTINNLTPGAGTHDERLKRALDSMRQLYAEVVGEGFYSPEREVHYNEIYQRSVEPLKPAPSDEARFTVTQEMIAAGKKVSDDKYTASIIESLDGGLGGGMKMSEAPAEIAQYFGCKKDGAHAFFEAMDALSPDPYGHPPTKEMVKAGNDRLTLLLEIICSGAKRKGSNVNITNLSTEIDYLIRSEDQPVAHAYRAMRAAAPKN